jgi:hypothetical protein
MELSPGQIVSYRPSKRKNERLIGFYAGDSFTSDIDETSFRIVDQKIKVSQFIFGTKQKFWPPKRVEEMIEREILIIIED